MKYQIFLMMLVLLPIVYSLEECQQITEPTLIPCMITSTWNYTPPCTSYKAFVYNSTGINIDNFTFQAKGGSSLCYFTWNITELGQYYFRVTNGDTGQLTVKNDNMALSIIIGIGIISAILLWIALSLEDEHKMLKLMLIFSSITLLTMIPSAVTSSSITAFHKAVMLQYRIFWIYVFVYLMYFVLQKMALWSKKSKVNNNS